MDHLGPELTKRDPPDPGDIIVRTKRPLLDVDGWSMQCIARDHTKERIRFQDMTLLVIAQGTLLDLDPNVVRSNKLTDGYGGLEPVVTCMIMDSTYDETLISNKSHELISSGSLLTFVWEWACAPGVSITYRLSDGSQWATGFRKVKK